MNRVEIYLPNEIILYEETEENKRPSNSSCPCQHIELMFDTMTVTISKWGGGISIYSGMPFVYKELK